MPAHISLFHSLPGAERDSILETLAKACRQRTPFPMTVSGLRNLGGGVAFAIESGALKTLHTELVRAFSEWLTPQDKQGFRPHITVQNKVTGSQAKGLIATLQVQSKPTDVYATGVQLWRYLGGPWESIARVPFELQV